jgi:hypothetical protein
MVNGCTGNTKRARCPFNQIIKPSNSSTVIDPVYGIMNAFGFKRNAGKRNAILPPLARLDRDVAAELGAWAGLSGAVPVVGVNPARSALEEFTP